MKVNHMYNGSLKIVRMDPLFFDANGIKYGFKVYRVSEDLNVKAATPQDYLKQLLAATVFPEEGKKGVMGMTIAYPSPIAGATAFNKVYTWRDIEAIKTGELPTPELYAKTKNGGRIQIEDCFSIDSDLENEILLHDAEQFRLVMGANGRKFGDKIINLQHDYLEKIPKSLKPYMMRH